MNVLETSKFTVKYSKQKTIELKPLEESFQPSEEDSENNYNPFRIQKLQNYNPIYSEFFILNESNYDCTALNNTFRFVNMNSVKNINTKEKVSKPVFIKFAPLLDPIRYMIGKYTIGDQKITSLPNLTTDESNCFPKLSNKNNTSYVDAFFSFLSSKLLHTHNFIHGIDYYGSFLGIQEKYKMNVIDDLEYLNSSEFFMENLGSHFTITHKASSNYINYGSRANKNRLNIISNCSPHNISAVSIGNIEEIADTNVTTIDSLELLEEVYEKPVNVTTSSGSSSSSSSSSNSSLNSSNDSEVNYSSNSSECDSDNESDSELDSEGKSNTNDDSDWETEDDDEDKTDTSNISEESNVYAYISNFPVQMICLEKCDGTFDDLFTHNIIDEVNNLSFLFQIIMILLTYQKAFHFTHNDLHTNNIMYINTDIEFLYYKYNGKFYKVPTYGKIMKIIDFGRAIYKYQGKTFCSDSFAPGGDAATQYNFEPYMDHNKPRLEPNFSFDLCRLGTSIYDFVIDEDDEVKDFDNFQSTIYRWCKDDSDKNVFLISNYIK